MKQRFIYLAKVIFVLVAITNTFAVFSQDKSERMRDNNASFYMLKNADLYFSKGKVVTAKEIYMQFADYLTEDQIINFASILVSMPVGEADCILAAKQLNALKESQDPTVKALKGQLYLKGVGYKKDTIRGMRLIEESIAAGNAYGYIFKAWYLSGQKKYTESFELLRKAADLGQSIAMNDLARYYDAGVAVTRNLDSARYWYLKSAEKGSGIAYKNLSSIYFSGYGVERNDKEAFRYIRLADEYGVLNYEQAVLLGACYLYGHGTPQNTDSALAHFAIAAAHGNPVGYTRMGYIYENLKGNKQEVLDSAIIFYLAGVMGGDIEANRYLGNIYLFDKMVPHDYEKAARLFKAGSDGGDLSSKVAYARLFLTGKGVPKDYSRYLSLLREASVMGNAQANFLLGMALDSTNKKESAFFFRQAIERGNSDAALKYAIILQQDNPSDPFISKCLEKAAFSEDPNILIDIYRNFPSANAIPQQEAERMFKILLDFEQTGNPDFKDKLAKFYVYGIGTPKNWNEAIRLQEEKYAIDSLFPNYIGYLYNYKEQPDYVSALKWYQIAVNKRDGDYAVATRNLFYLYYYGNGVPKDTVKAAMFLRESAKAGNIRSMAMLGINLWYGQGIGKDEKEALKWLEQSAEAGDDNAQDFLGTAMVFGPDSARHNYVKGFQWLLKSAKQGNSSALNNLGECYYTGLGTAKDFEKARYYYQLSADKNEPMGKVSLGVLYQKGDGVPADKEKARALFESACKDNLEMGCKLLQEL